MAGYLRLQDALNVIGDATQEREYAADVGNYSSVAVQVQVLKADANGAVQLQHAAVNEESAYTNVGNAVSMASTGSDNYFVLSSPLRYLRWTVTGNPTDGSFLIDLVARER